jgi:uncharacterized membrane-anchored protein YhcB (DUF1043 family)
MSFIIGLIIGLIAGALGLFFWARSNKKKAVELLNADFAAKIDELKDKVENEFDELQDDVKDKLKDLLDKLK